MNRPQIDATIVVQIERLAMECPFQPGTRYRVRRDFKALRDTFQAGEILVFGSVAYSRYDGMTGYVFTTPDDERPRTWDISDEENVGVWSELFEELRAGTG